MKILAFAGSAREESFNKKLVRLAAKAAEEAGAEVTLIDLRDFPMPLMDQDLEKREGIPEHGKRFKKLLREHEGWLIAAPEYNSGITPLLKNAIDWASRAESEGEEPLSVYKGKAAAIMSASPSGYGGARGLAQVRSILGNIKVTVLEDDVTIPKAFKAFDDVGQLIDPDQAASLQKVAQSLVAALQ
ncbi:MAG: NAD(P)H-dependent oxidoreductase [Gammaproteobacteria bacterium]|nr:NAD(P)H-dependent oxidoreductase [Gammaproteobacteria bacterium]MDH3412427.1 NAD(P)H-dependent oxidoreductase [Gammaproteobacteria bacterium]